MKGWLVIRQLPSGRWHVVSAFTFPTRAEAVAHLDFVKASVRKALRPEYRLAECTPERAGDEDDAQGVLFDTQGER